MATSGRDKFKKYFQGNPTVEVPLKGKPVGSPVSVYEAKTGAKVIAKLPDATKVLIIPEKEFGGRYFARYANGKKAGYFADVNVGKPIQQNDNKIKRLTAFDFVKSKKEVDFLYIDEKPIKSIEFTKADDLAKTILQNTRSIAVIDEEIYSSIESLLNHGTKIEWDDSISDQTKKFLGVYLGELMIGYLGLIGNKTNIKPIPWQGKASRFILPTDVSFSGVDSFIIDPKEIYPISSKSGKGAAASFFSNLLIAGIKNANKLPRSIFKDIVDTAKSIGITAELLEKKKGGRPILYQYGIRHILGISKSEIKDPGKIFDDIRMDRESEERHRVQTAILAHDKLEPTVERQLEESTTAFFCRVMADLLNRDPASMDIMTKILSGKDYYQANLNLPLWLKGEMQFNMVRSGKARLQIIGNKSSIGDLTAKQGLVNYILTRT